MLPKITTKNKENRMKKITLLINYHTFFLIFNQMTNVSVTFYLNLIETKAMPRPFIYCVS